MRCYVISKAADLNYITDIIYSLFYKTSCLDEDVNCTEPPSVSVPCLDIPLKVVKEDHGSTKATGSALQVTGPVS